MINYKFLAEYGGKKYLKIIREKINFFYLQNKSLPKNIDELRSKVYISEEDSQIFENRGKLERKLNSLQNSVILLRTVNKEDRGKYLSDNNQLITFNADYKLVDINEDDKNLGLYFINQDFSNFKKDPCPISLGTNGRSSGYL